MVVVVVVVIVAVRVQWANGDKAMRVRVVRVVHAMHQHKVVRVCVRADAPRLHRFALPAVATQVHSKLIGCI